MAAFANPGEGNEQRSGQSMLAWQAPLRHLFRFSFLLFSFFNQAALTQAAQIQRCSATEASSATTVGFLPQRPPRSRVRTMKLSRTVAYAVQATLQLAQAERKAPVPCSKLARQGHMPERFLLQILRNLVTHGILQSTRGVEGGYSLEKPPEQISLLEIIEAIEGPLAASVATHAGLDEQSLARLQEVLEGVTAKTRRDLAAVKLADLLPSGKS